MNRHHLRRPDRPHILLALAIAVTGCVTTRGAAPVASAAPTPQADPEMITLAERSGFTETSPYDSVVAYLRRLVRRAAALDSAGGDRSRFPAAASLVLQTMGTSTEGRALPIVVLARPMVRSASDAHLTGRPVVYVEANIHAGEVEGKEAVQALIRDLAVLPDRHRPSILDSIVVVIVPIYNADGNDHFAPQSVNRTEQNGPERVGERANGQHLDLNRDFVKAEAPETQATLAMFHLWDPDVFVDLHTTDGSFHGYALTYAPSLSPAALIAGPYTRDSLLPELRRRMHTRHQIEVFDYGNFEPERGAGPDTASHRWQTYDNRPRFGTNYVGLRNRIGILSEAYSHDTFGRRVASTYAFVREILSLVAERRSTILRLTAGADSAVAEWATHPQRAPAIPLAATFAPSTRVEPVLVEDLERLSGPGSDTVLTQPGVPRGVRRSGHIHPVQMPVVDRFAPTLADRLPWAYVVPASDRAIIGTLLLHGVRVGTSERDMSVTGVEQFIPDSVVASPTEFQGHHELHVVGRWVPTSSAITLPAGAKIVLCDQPLGVLAMYLLDPRSDDGLVDWNIGSRPPAIGQPYAVTRIRVPAAH